jgi:hypothetical protein
MKFYILIGIRKKCLINSFISIKPYEMINPFTNPLNKTFIRKDELQLLIFHKNTIAFIIFMIIFLYINYIIIILLDFKTLETFHFNYFWIKKYKA